MKLKTAALLGLALVTLQGCDAGIRDQLVDLNNTGGSTAQPLAPDPIDSNVAGDSGSNATDCELTESDQAMLDLVNQARVQPRLCGTVAFTATQPLKWSCQLMDAAIAHSGDMADNDFFSHSGSDGLQVSERVTATGFDWRAVGENIAAGYPDEAATVAALLDSPGHCENIMNPDYEEFGSASRFTERQVFPSYWTQVFATKF